VTKTCATANGPDVLETTCFKTGRHVTSQASPTQSSTPEGRGSRDGVIGACLDNLTGLICTDGRQGRRARGGPGGRAHSPGGQGWLHGLYMTAWRESSSVWAAEARALGASRGWRLPRICLARARQGARRGKIQPELGCQQVVCSLTVSGLLPEAEQVKDKDHKLQQMALAQERISASDCCCAGSRPRRRGMAMPRQTPPPYHFITLVQGPRWVGVCRTQAWPLLGWGQAYTGLDARPQPGVLFSCDHARPYRAASSLRSPGLVSSSRCRTCFPRPCLSSLCFRTCLALAVMPVPRQWPCLPSCDRAVWLVRLGSGTGLGMCDRCGTDVRAVLAACVLRPALSEFRVSGHSVRFGSPALEKKTLFYTRENVKT
jgi:hypothetical protein